MALNATKSVTHDALRDDPRIDFSFLISDVSRQMRKTFDQKMMLLGRIADANDRRVWRITATKLAQKRAEDIAGYAETLADEMFSEIPKQNLEQARQVLLTLQANMNA